MGDVPWTQAYGKLEGRVGTRGGTLLEHRIELVDWSVFTVGGSDVQRLGVGPTNLERAPQRGCFGAKPPSRLA